VHLGGFTIELYYDARSFFFFFFFFFLVFFYWHYNPLWVLAFSVILFHSALSLHCFLHRLTPIICKSSSISTIHLFRGLPLVLVPMGFHRNILLGVLLSSIRITWPSQAILLLFINLTISTRTYNVPFLSCQIRNSDNSIEYAQHFCKRSNCKVDPVHTVKGYRGSTSKHPLILNHCSKRMWLVNITPLPLPARKSPGTNWIRSSVSRTAGLDDLKKSKISRPSQQSNYYSCEI
jgi:hypothetical protein